MKNTKIRWISGVVIASVTLSGCVKVDYTAETEHPLQAQSTVVTDWSSVGGGISIPDDVVILRNGGVVIPYPDGVLPLVDPGDYRIVVYNNAEHIRVTPQTPVPPQTKGSVVATLTTDADGFIPALPDWFFSGFMDVLVISDRNYTENMQMHQQIRELNFDLTIAEGDTSRLTGIEAQFSGATSGWDLTANTPYGTTAKTKPVFVRNGARLMTQVRLLGIQGESQTLTLNLIFNDGRTQQIVSDVSTQLVGFNANKSEPITLRGNVQTPIASNLSGTITDWTVFSNDINVY